MMKSLVRKPERNNKMLLYILSAIALLLIAALLYFARHSIHIRSNWMYVVSVDAHGNKIGRGRWVRNPKPEVIDHNGLGHTETHIARMLTSRAPKSALIISTLDEQGGLLLFAEEKRVRIGLNIEWRDEPKREQAIRQLFRELKVAPTQDYLASNGGVPDSTRIMEYPLSGNAQEIAGTCQKVLKEIYGAGEEEGLKYSYEEFK